MFIHELETYPVVSVSYANYTLLCADILPGAYA